MDITGSHRICGLRVAALRLPSYVATTRNCQSLIDWKKAKPQVYRTFRFRPVA
jgi:hypothetical protein